MKSFVGINLGVELGDDEVVQGVSLDRPDTISVGIHHYSRIVARKNQLDHALIDTNLAHVRELQEYCHSEVSIRSMDVISLVLTTMAKVGSNTS